MLKFKKSQVLIIILIITLLPILASAAGFHSGKIYLQVEANGEAWYVNPTNDNRYYLSRPDDAFSLMRNLGLGISNEHIAQIPVGIIASGAADSDNDGLSDDMEIALGTNPNSADSDNDDFSDADELETWFNPNGGGALKINQALTNRLKGRILLQVEKNGEAWYLNPNDNKRYFLGRPADAFAIMRNLGIGITNNNLAAIRSNYVKESFTAANYYTIKYPDNWTRQISWQAGQSYKQMPIVHNLILTANTGAATLTAYILEPAKDFTLTDFQLNSGADAGKTSDRDIIVGVKPGKVQRFKYKASVKVNETQFNKGVVIYADVMYSTRKFLHLKLTIPNENDIALYENVLDQVLADLFLIY